MSGQGVLRSFAVATTRGLRRAANEDAMTVAGALLTGEVLPPLGGQLAGDDQAVIAVADGMGGHAHGALASREALSDLLADPARLAAPAGCVTALRQADLHLHTLMLARPEVAGMGTTIAGIAVQGAAFCWFNVGDSRIYRLRGGQLQQISVDDKAGCQGGVPGQGRHGILQSLGGRRSIAPIHPHSGHEPLLAGDRLLLCSDGLTDMVPDAAIAEILASCADAVATVARLMAAALQGGGLDNVSVMLAQ